VSRPVLLFAPGAGAPSSSPWMRRFAARLSRFAKVVPFDYSYVLNGRRAPDPLPKLVEAHAAALARARRDHEGPVFLVGKSMGGRVGCHLALEEKVSGVVCLGYPLVGQNGKHRDKVLLDLRTPVLFVQGTRDALCPLGLLEQVRAKMRAPNELLTIEGGDHSLEVRKGELHKAGLKQEDLDQQVCDRIGAFVGAA
jgi:uncharacterized protein